MPHLLRMLAAASLVAVPVLAQEPAGQAAMAGTEGQDFGTVRLLATPAGLLVQGELTGLPPGPHAFHIHATGLCEPPFDSAGGHFNPADTPHGFMTEGGPHGGDMPNLHVPESGAIAFEVLNAGITDPAVLFDGDGAALVIHAGTDDYASQPSGEAGGRIACGVIEAP